ncbi:MAG: hypothetical protein DMF61_20385 [Blastocatellia bacterium AA13]|nr:MAG: hypothetical protein DMF61_20385 [Blastocatellia bacterium AA13]
MKYLLSFSLLLLLAGTAEQAVAQETGPPPQTDNPGGRRGGQFQMPNFAEMDKNKDKKISRDEFKGPAQMFDRLDENKDGFIDEEEWNRRRTGGGGGPGRMGESFMKLLDANHDSKVTREEFAKIVQLFDSLDKDHNGELSPEELGRFFQAINEAPVQATGGVEVNNLFEKYDKNKDGKITADEMGDEKTARTLKALDLNKDGVVTKEEAEQALKQMAERQKARQAQSPQPEKKP